MIGDTWQKLWDKIKQEYADWGKPKKPMPNMQALVQNTMDQTPYTPQAQQYLKQVPVMADKNLPEKMGGSYTPNHPVQWGVRISPDQPDLDMPDVLRHEYLHSADANVNANVDASIPAYPIDSYGFSQKLSQGMPRTNAQMDQRLAKSGLYGNQSSPENMRMVDAEKLAYYMMDPNALLYAPEQLQNMLRQIYIPMSKNINYSPMYPTAEMLNAYMLQ